MSTIKIGALYRANTDDPFSTLHAVPLDLLNGWVSYSVGDAKTAFSSGSKFSDKEANFLDRYTLAPLSYDRPAIHRAQFLFELLCQELYRLNDLEAAQQMSQSIQDLAQEIEDEQRCALDHEKHLEEIRRE